MKRTYIAAAVLGCAAATSAMAADYYYYYPAGTTVVSPVAAPVVYYNDAATISVVQQRLLTAGYNVQVNGIMDAPTAQALKDFQYRQGFPQTGSIDHATMAALGLNRGGSGSVGGIPVVVAPATPIIIAAPARSDSLPRNYDGSIGDNTGGHGFDRTRAQWSANY